MMKGGVRIEEHRKVEEEEMDDDFGSMTPVSAIGSPTDHSRETLRARVEKWTEATGERACAIVYVATECFHVHKSALSRCGYLRRQLTNASVVTVNPPLNITAATFLIVAEFCYGADIVLLPDKLAALRTAAELLEMSEEDGNAGNLIVQTENYFQRMVATDQDYATIVLKSCVKLMPEAETAASLVSRCLEVLGVVREGDMLVERVEVVKMMKFEHFKVVAQKLRLLLPTRHDTLYIIIDHYIKGNMERLTEEQRSDLCSLVDCVKLEPRLLIHAVQCPRMPLRFIVRAMFADQVNARKSIISATSNQPLHPHTQSLNRSPESVSVVEEEKDMTLGGILHRDAALRHVELIKQEMETTSSKIKQLEEELKGMKTLLKESESDRVQMENKEHQDLSLSKVDSRRCTSLRILTSVAAANRVQKGERGSVSSITLPRSLHTTSSDTKTQRAGKGFGAKLLSGLKNVFWASGPKQEKESFGCRVGRKAQYKPI